MGNKQILRVLLADDDQDDRFLFDLALKRVGIETKLTTASNGKILMDRLNQSNEELPDVLFLDLNMPLKNGNECLTELKASNKLRDIPVVIYSTSLRDEIVDVLYANGAHYYMQKTDLASLEQPLQQALTSLSVSMPPRPERNGFVLNYPKRLTL